MYVCLCNGIKASELQQLARAGVRTAAEACRQLGVEMNCVGCSECVQAFIDRALDIPASSRKSASRPGRAA